MMKDKSNPSIDAYLEKSGKWQEEMRYLRELILECGLREELKWGKPCYTFDGTNVVILQPFKDYCALMFCKGALLKDVKGILIKPGENTQAARQVRFTNVREIVKLKASLKAYIKEAVDAERSGLKVKYKETTDYAIPEELQTKLNGMPEFRMAFEGLTPGRQRGYILYFSAPKQSKTRTARVEKCLPQILEGKGLHD